MREVHYAPGESPGPKRPEPIADLILVGGGLANGLIAWRLAKARPQLRILVLESGPTLGGNHTWSFHTEDLDEAQRAWIEPLVCHRWPGHEVIFPGRRRRIAGGYRSISSARFHEVLARELGARIVTDVQVAEVEPTGVRLADGTLLRARAVIDGRGARPSPHLTLGFQKFLGQELRTAAPHGLDWPILMDATVAQHGGYRFVYVLPLAPDVLLIEDTCYADGAAIDAAELRQRVGDYARAHEWTVAELLREEQGVLPILLGGDPQAFWREANGVPLAGLSAALFHPTTGYSLPEAVRLADRIAQLPELSAARLFDAIRRHALSRWKAQRFFRVLNRMLFRAAESDQRWRVMHRFYGLPEGLIGRFYAARLNAFDKLRLVTGKPPVPFFRGVRAAFDMRRQSSGAGTIP
ncbi:Lycopene cyclase [Burkholderiales bacterium 8X]|nr:Lycopene cyclase [Burkholderiales bacterium 8X]